MDLFDSLALWGRKYEQQTVPRSGSTSFGLNDLLEMFDRNVILELTPETRDKAGETVRPDPVRKTKVSLLDSGISAIHSTNQDRYEVFRTAPSGEHSRVKIVARSSDGSLLGTIRMTVGPRSYAHYFREDPIFESLPRTP